MAAGENKIGSIVWQDLTVQDADRIRDFYQRVIGWESKPVDMGDYDDYEMVIPSNGKTAAGICHARGGNAKLPNQWLIYFAVESVEDSIRACQSMGGKIIDGPRKMSGYDFVVIQDPQGAVCGLLGMGEMEELK